MGCSASKAAAEAKLAKLEAENALAEKEKAQLQYERSALQTENRRMSQQLEGLQNEVRRASATPEDVANLANLFGGDGGNLGGTFALVKGGGGAAASGVPKLAKAGGPGTSNTRIKKGQKGATPALALSQMRRSSFDGVAPGGDRGSMGEMPISRALPAPSQTARDRAAASDEFGVVEVRSSHDRTLHLSHDCHDARPSRALSVT
jgi:hypothetical protein